jgi:hypothetical protein
LETAVSNPRWATTPDVILTASLFKIWSLMAISLFVAEQLQV